MHDTDLKTQENILQAGKAEFLQKGFLSASLRNIVKNAGVTTGAFYGYYKSKEELFDALVSEQKQCFLDCFNKAQDDFSHLPPEQQPDNMGEITKDCLFRLLDYMYTYPDAFKLLLCCAAGTRHENFLDSLVETEVHSTHRFIDVLSRTGHQPKAIDEQLEHMLVSGMFSAFFETVIHDMPQAQAYRYVEELREFYTAGWRKIMGF